MKVLAVASYGVLGGAELALLELIRHRPADVEVAALLVEDGPLRGRLEAEAVATWAGGAYDGRPDPRSLGRFARSMRQLLRRTRPDVIWAVGLKAAFMALPAARLERIPLVWYKVDFSLDAELTRPLAASVNGVVSVSNAAAAAMGPRLRRRKLIDVVGPPVRLPESLHVSPNRARPAIGTMGTLIPIKGHRHIVEAAAQLSEEFPTIEVVLAGAESPDYPTLPAELRELACDLGVDGRLDLVGFTDDVGAVLSRLTVYVNATYRDERGFGWEGLSGAMLEASWAGLPVVATNGGGTPEGVQDGLTGRLVAPGDVQAIAEAIAPYLRDPELATAAGSAGSRFARARFSPRVSAERMFAALRSTAL